MNLFLQVFIQLGVILFLWCIWRVLWTVFTKLPICPKCGCSTIYSSEDQPDHVCDRCKHVFIP